MKVICVKPFDNKFINFECQRAPRPEVGDRCIVTKTFMDEAAKAPYYTLLEFPGYSYKAENFATIPDADQEVAIECEREAIVNLETA